MTRLGFMGLVLAMSCNTASGQLNAPINEYLGTFDASAAAKKLDPMAQSFRAMSLSIP